TSRIIPHRDESRAGENGDRQSTLEDRKAAGLPAAEDSAYGRRRTTERWKLSHEIQCDLLANIVRREPALRGDVVRVNYLGVDRPRTRPHRVYQVDGLAHSIGGLERVVLVEDLPYRKCGAIVAGRCTVIPIVHRRKIGIKAVQRILILNQVSG